MIRILDQSGNIVPIAGDRLVLEEARTYWVVPDPPGRIEVRFGNLRLEAAGRGFRLPTGHWVGRSSLVGEGADGRRRDLEVEVVPRPEKLAQDAWGVMLDELDDWVAGVTVGLEGGREGSVGLDGASVGVLVEALSPLIPDLDEAVRALQEMPRERLVARRRSLPAHAIRRADSGLARWVAKNPLVAARLRGEEVESKSEEDRLPQLRAESDLNHPANSYVAWGLWRIERLQLDLAEVLDRASRNRDGGDHRAWCLERGRRLREDAGSLRRMTRRSFLREVRRAPPTEAALLTVLDDPAYARVHRLLRRFLGARFSRDIASTRTQASVRPSYELYELWVFLAVVRALERDLPEVKVRWRLRPEPGALAGIGRGSAAILVVPGGDRLEVHFNLVFPNYLVHPEADRVALTGERRPDLVVAWIPADGPPAWVVIDAKYRVGRRNLSDAFTSCHVYRDALRWSSMGGTCRGCLLAAPAGTDDTGPWFQERFWESHGLGAMVLTPGVGGEGSLADRVLQSLTVSPGS